VPFRASFACLWCGTAHSTRGPDDLEGWAQLCPTCIGKAGENNFLRARLRQGLTERSAAAGAALGGAPTAPGPATGPGAITASPVATAAAASDHSGEQRPEDELRAAASDDWYLRRGRYARGAIHDAAWHAELDMVGRWLDAVPFSGELVELAAGTGWWSPLLASKGELSLYDTSPGALDKARDRLLAHGLRAHLHERDAWAEPDRRVGGLFAGFWLSHVERALLPAFLELVGRWLQPGGRFAFVDALPDPASGAADHPEPASDEVVRRLDDGREFRIVKVYRTAEEYAVALRDAGFVDVEVGTTGRFFVHGAGRMPGAD
jgi:SAM-dependent methyltransferase